MERQARNIDVDTAEVVYELPFILLPGVVFTLIFLHLDSVCCCCRCLLLPPGQVSVYDPSNQELELVLRDGRVLQVTEEDEEEVGVEAEPHEQHLEGFFFAITDFWIQRRSMVFAVVVNFM